MSVTKMGAVEVENKRPAATEHPETSEAGQVAEHIWLSPAEEKRLLRKIDLHLLPVMFILYLLQYLDKTSLGYTAIMGIIQDAHLEGTEYSWVSSFFYVGFLVASPVAAAALVKFPVGKVVIVSVLVWAGILMCMAAGHNFGSLSALRLLLGAFESAINPGFTILTSMFYKPSEHALRHGLWYSGASIAYIFAGILSYAVSHIKSSLATWKILFLLFGAITFVWGVAMYWLLPDSPQTARFLTEVEQKQAFARVQGLRRSADTRKWNGPQFKEALVDPRTWLLFFLAVFTTLPGGGLAAFSSIITKSFGYNIFQTYLLGMTSGAFLLFFVIFTVVISIRFKNARCISIALLNIISLVGVLMIKLVEPEKKLTRLAGLWLVNGYASAFPTILSLISSNITGHTKKAVVSAVLFLGFCAGYIIGPLTFLAREAPTYSTAYNIMIACFVLNITIVMMLRQIMAMANKKREVEYGSADVLSAEGGEDALMHVDETDFQNKSIRYSL